MKLSENPIFITHKRLVHRRGVLAAIIIAALIGVSLLAGMGAYLATPHNFNFSSRQEAGEAFYNWTMGIEILVLVLGGFGVISRALTEDRKAGLWDSNRLTPLRPAQIVTGYWLAPALRECYMAMVLAAFGLLFTLLGHLPLTFWLGTQTLIVSTALLFGLLGILAGMAFQGSQGMLLILACLVILPFSMIAPSRMVINFLLPVYGIGNLLPGAGWDYNWRSLPHIFGFSIHPVLLTLILQLFVGVFVWRALVRKAAHPFQPLLLRWEAAALFTVIIASQHALLWDLWQGEFPSWAHADHHESYHQPLLAIVHGGTILVGIALLVSASPAPECLRVESLRSGFHHLGAVFSRSSVSLALVLAVVTSAAMFTHGVFSWAASFRIFLAVSINILEIFLVFALLLEFCRLRYQRRAPGYIALWLFSVAIIPFILAGVFSSEYLARISLLAPGFFALAGPSDDDWPCLFCILLAHFGLVVLLFIAWQREWKRLLGKAI